MIRLSIWVKDIKTVEVFIVSCISEDPILEMLFLTSHQCSMDFTYSVLLIDGRKH